MEFEGELVRTGLKGSGSMAFVQECDLDHPVYLVVISVSWSLVGGLRSYLRVVGWSWSTGLGL